MVSTDSFLDYFLISNTKKTKQKYKKNILWNLFLTLSNLMLLKKKRSTRFCTGELSKWI